MRRWKARASELFRTGNFRAASSVRLLSGLRQLGRTREFLQSSSAFPQLSAASGAYHSPLALQPLALFSHAFAIINSSASRITEISRAGVLSSDPILAARHRLQTTSLCSLGHAHFLPPCASDPHRTRLYYTVLFFTKLYQAIRY